MSRIDLDLIKAAFIAMDANNLLEAEALFNKVVAIDSKVHLAWNMLAVISIMSGMADIGVVRAARAVALDRRNPSYLNTLAVATGELGQLHEARDLLLKVVKLSPGYAEGYYNLGKVYSKLGQFKLALDSYRRGYAIDPNYSGLRFNYAYVSRLSGNFELAKRLLSEILVRDPTDADATVQLLEIKSLGLPTAELIELLCNELIFNPQLGPVHERLATLYLTEGFRQLGWEEYWYRMSLPKSVRDNRLANINLVPYFADSCIGQIVMVRAEQGIGDMLFFLRFVNELRERGAKILLELQPKLIPLVQHLNVVDDILPQKLSHDASVEGGVHCWAGDLPLLLKSFSTPKPFPLVADPKLIDFWRSKLAEAGPAPYLGLTWRAGTDAAKSSEFDTKASPLRSLSKQVPIKEFTHAVSFWPGTFVSIQRNPYPEEHQALVAGLPRLPIDLSAANDDLTNMLALLACLDDYACVSNANVHLRAGLGLGGRILSPEPEFRWGSVGPQSPWFQGWQVYRRQDGDGWGSALDQLKQDIQQFSAGDHE